MGMGAGQPNRVTSVMLAARAAGDKAKGAVMASDAFFPFPDGIEAAAEAGITAVIQPGGSIRDHGGDRRRRRARHGDGLHRPAPLQDTENCSPRGASVGAHGCAPAYSRNATTAACPTPERSQRIARPARSGLSPALPRAGARPSSDRIFRVDAVEGRIVPPDSMRPWIERHFGAVDATLPSESSASPTSSPVAAPSSTPSARGARTRSTARRSRPSTSTPSSPPAPTTRSPILSPARPADVFGRVEGKLLRHRRQRRQVRRLSLARHLQGAQPPALRPRDAPRLHRHRPSLGSGRPRRRPGGEVLPLHLELPLARRRLARPRPRSGAARPRRPLSGGRAPAPRRPSPTALDHGADYFDDLYRAHASVGCGFEKAGRQA